MYKDIRIKCIPNYYNYKIIINDENDRTICYEQIKESEIKFCGIIGKIYIIKISSLGKVFYGVIRVKENTNILFNIDLYINNNLQNINFILQDKFYKGLKIQKGKLILWQNLIQ